MSAAAEVESSWLRNSIDLMASLAEEVHFAEAADADETAFAAARTALNQLDFSATALAVPDVDGLDFHLRLCDPAARRPDMHAELAFQVSKGRFGWALRQSRPVLLAASETDCALLLHPLATRSRVIGVFMGLIDDPNPVIPSPYFKLISQAFFHFASVIECTQLSHQVRVAKELLAKRADEMDTQLRQGRDLLASEHRQATRMLEKLGRELQTAASGIAGMSSRLLAGKLAGEERDAARSISDNAGRIAATLGDLATWCRLDEGSFEFTRRDFDAADIVSHVQRELDSNAQAKGVTLTSSVDPDLPHLLRGDPDRLQEILKILTGTAIGASEAGEVSIQVHEMSNSQHSSVIRFEVQASRAELDPRVADRFFDPFGEERSLPRRLEESGVRLALCKRLVEGMQGQLGVVVQPGRGTRFWCNIQLSRPTEGSSAPEAKTPALRALLVGCEGPLADRIEKTIERRGHHVARQLASNDLPDPKRIDILVLGSLVDGGPAAHMCRRFRRLPGGREAIVLALAHQEDVEGMLDAGADDCLLGSMDDDALDARIAVAERAARRLSRKPSNDF